MARPDADTEAALAQVEPDARHDPARAASALTSVLEEADAAGGAETAVLARLALAEARLDLGDGPGARAAAIEALGLAEARELALAGVARRLLDSIEADGPVASCPLPPPRAGEGETAVRRRT